MASHFPSVPFTISLRLNVIGKGFSGYLRPSSPVNDGACKATFRNTFRSVFAPSGPSESGAASGGGGAFGECGHNFFEARLFDHGNRSARFDPLCCPLM